MNLTSKLSVFLLCLFVFSCIIKRPDDTPDLPQKVNIKISIDKMQAFKSCENDGTSGIADLYNKITIYKRENIVSELETLAETDLVLVQLKRYESIDDPLSLDVDVELKDGMIIATYIHTYEQDGGGSKQIQRQFAQSFVYEEDLGCWLEDANECAFGTTPGTSNLNRSEESRMTDNTCDVIYQWSTAIREL